MTMKRVEPIIPPALVLEGAVMPSEWTKTVKFSTVTDEDMVPLSQLRGGSDPWKSRGETPEETLETLGKLRPFINLAKMDSNLVGYVSIERDGPVPGAAYLRNIVVRADLRKKGLGTFLLDHGLQMARDLHRKTVALRVDPANAPAVSFYRKNGFTTVATVVSKKSGKLRLLMSKEL